MLGKLTLSAIPFDQPIIIGAVGFMVLDEWRASDRLGQNNGRPRNPSIYPSRGFRASADTISRNSQ
jgi:hypothetical protein